MSTPYDHEPLQPSYPEFEVGPEETQFRIALDMLQAAQGLLDDGAELDGLRQFIGVAQANINPLLKGKHIVVSGFDILGPVTDSKGNIVDYERVGGIVCGEALLACGIEADDTGQIQLGIQIKLGEKKRDTAVEQARIIYKAFAPVKDCLFLLELDETPVSPELEDELAKVIRDLMTQVPSDVAGLARLVSETFGEFPQLKRDFYLSYINQLLPSKSPQIRTAKILTFADQTHQVSEHPEDVFLIGEAVEFFLHEPDNPEAEQPPKLLLSLTGEHGGLVRVFAEDLIELRGA
jgi:hypothetical protein